MAADQELLKKAIAEAYASAPADAIIYDTLEIDHPSFTRPIRVVRWPLLGPDPVIFRFRLEDNAPLNPGEVVEFIGFPFELKIPESSSEAEGAFELRISVHQDIDNILMNAALNPGVITAIYRSFVKGMELDGPSEIWPGIEIQSPERVYGDIVARGVILGWMNKAFGSLYTPGKYPGAVSGQ